MRGIFQASCAVALALAAPAAADATVTYAYSGAVFTSTSTSVSGGPGFIGDHIFVSFTLDDALGEGSNPITVGSHYYAAVGPNVYPDYPFDFHLMGTITIGADGQVIAWNFGAGLYQVQMFTTSSDTGDYAALSIPPGVYGPQPYYASSSTSEIGSWTIYGLPDTSTSDAPEPATWAMFIGGFGLIGAGLRRRLRPTVRFA